MVSIKNIILVRNKAGIRTMKDIPQIISQKDSFHDGRYLIIGSRFYFYRGGSLRDKIHAMNYILYEKYLKNDNFPSKLFKGTALLKVSKRVALICLNWDYFGKDYNCNEVYSLSKLLGRITFLMISNIPSFIHSRKGKELRYSYRKIYPLKNNLIQY